MESSPRLVRIIKKRIFSRFPIILEVDRDCTFYYTFHYVCQNRWIIIDFYNFCRIYCEYNSGSGAEQLFRTPEDRVLHFLSRTKRPGWKWMSLRPRSPLQKDTHIHQNINKQEKDSYFCKCFK